MEKYVVCMFIGHGAFYTQSNEELVPINSYPLKMNICTFAPPGEGCFYPPESMISLKNKLIEYSSPIEDFSDTFQQVFHMAQKESLLGTTYNSPDWAPFFNKRHDLSELCVKTNFYYEKKFSTDKDLPCGVYIINNNIDLPKNAILSFDDPQFQSLSGVINFFTARETNQLFIIDATCSLFLNPARNNYITDKRTIRRLRHDFLKFPRLGGKRKTRNRKRKKCKTRKSYVRFS